MNGDVDLIRYLAIRLRGAIEVSPVSSRPITARNFPNGACGDASLLLGAFLVDHNINGFRYQSGRNYSDANRPYSHAWLVRDGLVVDITADQFEFGFPSILISQDERWYGEFDLDEPGEADFRAHHDGFPELARYYASLLRNLD